MESAIREYFSKFGAVKSIYFNKGYGPGKFGFVRFYNVESATAAIAQRKHKIGDKTITAKAAYEYHQPSSDEDSSDEYRYFDSDFDDFDFDSDY